MLHNREGVLGQERMGGWVDGWVVLLPMAPRSAPGMKIASMLPEGIPRVAAVSPEGARAMPTTEVHHHHTLLATRPDGSLSLWSRSILEKEAKRKQRKATVPTPTLHNTTTPHNTTQHNTKPHNYTMRLD
jgi:hypothetical protein